MHPFTYYSDKSRAQRKKRNLPREAIKNPSISEDSIDSASLDSNEESSLMTVLLSKSGHYVVWNGQNVDLLVETCLKAITKFESHEIASRRKEDNWKQEFGVNSWSSDSFAVSSPLNSKEIELLSECIPHNKYWTELQLKFNHDGLIMNLFMNLGENMALCESLVSLDLGGQNLSDDVISNLAIGLSHRRSRSLRKINLCKNDITNEGVKVLFEVLQVIPVENLNLSFNNFDDIGSTWISASLEHTSLTTLNISNNQFVFINTESIMDSKVTTLYVGYTGCLKGDKYMESLTAGKLKSLSVETCNVSELGIHHLETNSVLQELDLSENTLLQSHSTMACLSKSLSVGATSLCVLRLNGIPLNGTGVFAMLVAGILGGARLKELYIRTCSLNSDVFNVAGPLIFQISTLDVSGNPLGRCGVEQLHGVLVQAQKYFELSASNCGVQNEAVCNLFANIPTVSLWGMDLQF
ncbi:RNI-like protein [Rhizoclosmatium globosum]|uniref:RNI-like protein n=1 Tax=Rhizoclosmatium globosum TaxID=329046 RepID=A0A1Y2C0J8_9FUNG|nr:RNI-like protein [Rhizoclosmatium globosum]|eukprot:ORY40558.1 RNI-like protein [Rhizoclosmatium globosum]